MSSSKMNKNLLHLRIDFPQNSSQLSPPAFTSPLGSPPPKQAPSSTHLLHPGLVPPPQSPPPTKARDEVHFSEWVLPIRGDQQSHHQQPNMVQLNQNKAMPAMVGASARGNKQLDEVRYGGIREYEELKFVKSVLEKRAMMGEKVGFS